MQSNSNTKSLKRNAKYLTIKLTNIVKWEKNSTEKESKMHSSMVKNIHQRLLKKR